MLVATDVSYNERAGTARAIAGVFSAWNAPRLSRHYTDTFGTIEDYVPGEFYRRELPCLQAVLSQVTAPIDAIIVDGHVWLGKKPGLGHHLWAALGEEIPVIGVAKNRFHTGGAQAVVRGGSKKPLYVSAVGIPTPQAARHIVQMHGGHRLPTLLKAVDDLSRGRQTPPGGPPDRRR